MKPEPDITAPIPDDTRAALIRAKKAPVYIVRGKYLDITAARETLEPLTEEQRALAVHVARWNRFYSRWNGRRHHVARLCEGMTVWEARKAAFSIDDASQFSWFVGLPPVERMKLVKDMQERRASERRFQLAKQRFREDAIRKAS